MTVPLVRRIPSLIRMQTAAATMTATDGALYSQPAETARSACHAYQPSVATLAEASTQSYHGTRVSAARAFAP